MGSVRIVGTLEFPQGVEQMPLILDRGPVPQLAPTGLHPAFHGRVHPRHPDTAEHDLGPRIGEDRVDAGRGTFRPGSGSGTAPGS
ncbi:hypothetical protein GCM10010415_64910 [Streptomyces atrovirens]